MFVPLTPPVGSYSAIHNKQDFTLHVPMNRLSPLIPPMNIYIAPLSPAAAPVSHQPRYPFLTSSGSRFSPSTVPVSHQPRFPFLTSRGSRPATVPDQPRFPFLTSHGQVGVLSGVFSQRLDGNLWDRERRLTEGEVGDLLTRALQLLHLIDKRRDNWQGSKRQRPPSQKVWQKRTTNIRGYRDQTETTVQCCKL